MTVAGGEPLPLEGEHAVALQISEGPVVTQHIEAVVTAFHGPAWLVAAVGAVSDVGGDDPSALLG